MSGIATVGVVGLGLMGSGIAEVCARAGLEVRAVESGEAALQAGLGRIRASLARAVDRGKAGQEEADAASARIRASTELTDLAGCDLVIEAIVEDQAAKLELFGRLDAILGADAILASNTSAIPIGVLSGATSRPGSVIGVHFFNPAPVMQLVEVIPALRTDERTVERAREFVRSVGKTAVAAPDRAGFVVNALLIPYLLSAIRMLETGHATADDIDTAMRLGCAHPMGPLELADLAGLDTVASAAWALHREHHEPHYAPPPLLQRMVEAGMLGRKSGRGFFSYDAAR
ncbi:3-hydroxybutyryl-CoA dehydrogenase [soil metagenome]